MNLPEYGGFSLEQIQQLNEICKPFAEHLRKTESKSKGKWAKENPKKYAELQKKYLVSEKGRLNRKKVLKKRIHIFKKDSNDIKMKEMIQKFYDECPKGYDVDHIYPLSKGGAHCLSNMQYLKAFINRAKNNYILHDPLEFPHCVLRIEEKILNRHNLNENRHFEELQKLNEFFENLEKRQIENG